MKKTVVVSIMFIGLFMTAQEHHRKEGRRAMPDLSPEQIANLKTKKMTLALDLTKNQQVKIKSLLTAKAEERKAKMEAQKERKENREMGKPSPEERYAMANARLDLQIAHKKEVKAILDEVQYAKWEKMREKRRHHMKRYKKDKRSGKK
ncbi:hypothetical protein [Maribacter sp. 2304DJ31-5]|uniref:hypothetical protein n=1 Tax=Maribacter sp. 2304DJ31-5 TaxID=3386273 RepID=UPI0039BD518B